MRRYERRIVDVLSAVILLLGATNVASGQFGSMLWKVSAEGGAVNYVFGTIHLADSLVFHQPRSVLEALDRSTIVVTELDLDSLQSGGMNPEMFMAAPNAGLRDVLHDSDYAVVKAYVAEHLGPMVLMTMDRLSPAALGSIMMLSRLQRTAPLTIDEFIWNRAKLLGIRLRGIESSSEQLAVLDKVPPEMVVEFARNPEEFDSLYVELRRAYIEADYDAIAALTNELGAYESFNSAINDDRNAIMAGRLQPLLSDGGVFVAVGAAHLGGPKGLLQHLRDRGFMVESTSGEQRQSMLLAPTHTSGNTRRTTR